MENRVPHTDGEARKLPYQLLKSLTNDFAPERKLGSGTFGVVYKGVYENNGEEIAVKLFPKMVVDDTEFQKEFQNLRSLKHQNIVELKGYCNETEDILTLHQGKPLLVGALRLALCLEYIDNGSLSEHLSDECEGLNWHLRYKIIKGICEGLKYLREGLAEPIWHLDLKPSNILLDKNMVPKIADFGLSRLFGEERTKQTITNVGTPGYWPPEYIKNQVLSNGYDIFSLGVIIAKIMTGRDGYSLIADMKRRKFIKHVHDNWKKKLQETLTHSLLEVYCRQVKTCIEVALKCMLPNRHDRPTIQEIVLNFNETETLIPNFMLQKEQIEGEGSIGISKSSDIITPSSENGGEESGSSYTVLRGKRLDLQFLKSITDGFSGEHLIGEGGFARVYKGVYENGKSMAVKVFHEIAGDDDSIFRNEVEILMKARHRNIMRLIGYCLETQHEVVEYKGKLVFAESRLRALCMEYLQNGSLDRYISDESSGLEWHTRYQIIKGICEGLSYLHNGLPTPIIRLDLKPGNIMLDKHMVPRIGDLGLAIVHGESHTSRTIRVMGTMGYMAPEFIDHGVFSDKYDIYSLGVVIEEIITGRKFHTDIDNEIMLNNFIESVLQNWRKRFEATVKATSSVEGYCQQVKKCIEIALKCLKLERLKRPSIGDVLHMLNETEAFIYAQDDPDDLLLDIHPGEVVSFPFEPKKLVSSSLRLTNKWDDHVAFRLLAGSCGGGGGGGDGSSSRRYLTKLPLCGVVPPRCTYTVALTMRKQPSAASSGELGFLTLECIDVRDLDVEYALPDSDFFGEADEPAAGGEAQKVTLGVAYGAAEEGTSVQIICTPSSRHVVSVEVHPSEPWILTSNHGGNVCIWNYETMATVNSFDVSEQPVCSAKFVAREGWFVAGDGHGSIYVYSYNTSEEDTSFEAHGGNVTSLAVHPTQPYVLSSSDADHAIKLWNWENGWECTQTFHGHSSSLAQLCFEPMGTNSFASASLDGKVKIWTLDSADPVNTLEGHSGLVCVNYGNGDHHTLERYLLTGCKDGIAQIWDLEKEKCIRKLEGHADCLSVAHWHQELSILITGSLDGTIRIWNSTTYRMENIINFNLGAVYAFGCIKDSRRIVVGCNQGIAMMEVNLS